MMLTITEQYELDEVNAKVTKGFRATKISIGCAILFIWVTQVYARNIIKALQSKIPIFKHICLLKAAISIVTPQRYEENPLGLVIGDTVMLGAQYSTAL